MKTQTLKLILLALVAFFIICALASCGSYIPAAQYAKEHRDNNYESRLEAAKKADAKLAKELAKEKSKNK